MSLISLLRNLIVKFAPIGFKTDQQGILKRYINERKNWDDHLQNCKNFILNQSQELKSGKVAVLGSGWLLDVPINELLNKFDQVWLFDIHHPIQIRRKFEKNPKIKFITVDLTNQLAIKAKESNSFSHFLNCLKEHKRYVLPEKFDFVVSVNILNQLDIIICDYLNLRFKPTDHEMKKVRQKIQSQHLELLMENNTCLITDAAELYINDNGKVMKQVELLYSDISDFSLKKSWVWVFDTHKNYRQKFNTSFNVCAYSL